MPDEPNLSASLGGDRAIDHRTLNTVFSTLAHRDRRLVLDHLTDCPGGTTTLDALAEAVVGAKSDCEPDGRTVRDVRTTLHHVHLPKLDDSNVVRYDPVNHLVHYRETPAVERLLQVFERGRRRCRS